MELREFITTTIREYLNEQVGDKHGLTLKKIKTFKTCEGKFSVYDISNDIRGRADMFTVFEDKNGWIVRNAFVPDELQRKGIATKFYIEMNEKSKQKTGIPLRSTQQRILSNGKIVHELSKDGISLWDSFVNKGLARKISEKNYILYKENIMSKEMREMIDKVKSFNQFMNEHTLNENNIIVYHGTNKDFGDFDSNLQNSVTGFGDFGKGFYFTKSKGIAKYYTLKSKDNRTIIKTTVSINNPFIIDIDGEKFSTETKEKYMKLKYLESYEVEIIREYIMSDVEFAYKKINKEIGDSRFSNILQDNGYDGVIVNRTLNGETSIGAEIVVYNKNQIGDIEVEKV